MSEAGGLAWRLLAFDDLARRDLYAVLQLRSQVFVVEQNCVFLDMDGLDAQALHLLGERSGALLAYARCFGPGVKYAEASVGRVATRFEQRGEGLGHLLIERALASVAGRWGRQPVRIGAQARLRRFYEGHGFVDAGIPYVEDGIDHLEMLWQPEKV